MKKYKYQIIYFDYRWSTRLYTNGITNAIDEAEAINNIYNCYGNKKYIEILSLKEIK